MMPLERGILFNRFPQFMRIVLVRVGQCVLLLCWFLVAGVEDSSIRTAPATVSGTDTTLGFVALASPREIGLPLPTSSAQRTTLWGHYRRELLSYSPVYQGWGGSSQTDGCPASWHTLDSSKNTGLLRRRKKSTAALELCHRATIEAGRDGGESTSLSASLGGKVTQGSASLSTGKGKLSNVDRTPTRDVDIVKPERDDRSYRHLELPNQLAVMIVSDRHTETAAASMFIRVGHMQDPDELPGMAHFHEHRIRNITVWPAIVSVNTFQVRASRLVHVRKLWGDRLLRSAVPPPSSLNLTFPVRIQESSLGDMLLAIYLPGAVMMHIDLGVTSLELGKTTRRTLPAQFGVLDSQIQCREAVDCAFGNSTANSKGMQIYLREDLAEFEDEHGACNECPRGRLYEIEARDSIIRSVSKSIDRLRPISQMDAQLA